MATGRIGVTPTLRTRWSKLPTTGTTSLSGLDDNSVALVYDAGYEAVYRNGVLLSRGNDYTATNGTTVTLIDATLAGDVVEIFANDLVPLTDAISKGQYNAKGALLSATAASTPAVLAVGTNNQVLTADSTTATGLKWATTASASPASQTNFVSDAESTTSGTFAGLTTAQTITMTTGTKVLVLLSAGMSSSTTGNAGNFSVAVSGATTRSATTEDGGTCAIGSTVSVFTTHVYLTLTAGSNTFTMQYRSAGDTLTYRNRRMTIIDLGS